MPLNRNEALERLQFLHDQVHQTAERARHLQERLPFPLQPRSVNYEQDLHRIREEYNRLARAVQEQGLATAGELRRAGLPPEMPS